MNQRPVVILFVLVSLCLLGCQRTFAQSSGSTVVIKNTGSGLCLDTGGVKTTGSYIYQSPCSSSSNQNWSLLSTPYSGWLYFKNQGSGLNWDMQNGSTSAGALVWQYTSVAVWPEYFKFKLISGNNYEIISGNSPGYCIEIQNGSLSSGARIVQNPCTGSARQVFTIYSPSSTTTASPSPSASALVASSPTPTPTLAPSPSPSPVTTTSGYPNSINVKNYGAVGDGSHNDTTAIQNAINALSSGTALSFPCGTYLVSGQISLRKSGVALQGQSAGCVTLKMTSGASIILYVGGSGLSGTTSLTANSNEGSMQASANFGGLGAGSGSYVVLSEGGRGYSTDTSPGHDTLCDVSGCRTDVMKISSATSSAATFTRPLSHPFSTVNAATVAKMSPITNVLVSNLNFECSNAISRGLFASFIVNSRFENIMASNCVDAGVKGDYGFANTFSGITVNHSGSSGEGAFMVNHHNQSLVQNAVVNVNPSSHNFGFGAYSSNDSTFSAIKISAGGSTGRAFKTVANAHNAFTDISVTGVSGGTSAFAIEYYTHHNTFTRCSSTNNVGHSIATFGNYNAYNTWINCTATSNSSGNAFNQSTGALGLVADHHNTIQGGTFTGTVSSYAVMQMNSSYLTMTSVTVKGPGGCGLCLGGLSGEVVNGSNVTNNYFSGFSAGKDISFTSGGGTGNIFSANSTPDGTYPSPLP